MKDLELATRTIQHFEGCRLTAYWDSLGAVWTIGWGDTANVRKGDTITQAEADQKLAQRVAALDPEIPVSITGVARRAALMDFAYNAGSGALHQLLSHPDTENQLERWVYAGGRVVQQQVKRRAVDRYLWSLDELLQ